MYYPELKSECDKGITSFVRHAIDRQEMPMSNFHLSSGYTATEDNKRCVFHWNRTRFSDPSQFFATLRDTYGVVVSPNVKPGMLLVHPDRERFEATDFVTHVSGTKPYVDSWWGGQGTFVDFTNPHARSVWQILLRERLLQLGVVSIWNDNNEYECVRDRRSLCHGDGKTITMAQAKPIQANLMAWTAVRFHNRWVTAFSRCAVHCQHFLTFDMVSVRSSMVFEPTTYFRHCRFHCQHFYICVCQCEISNGK